MDINPSELSCHTWWAGGATSCFHTAAVHLIASIKWAATFRWVFILKEIKSLLSGAQVQVAGWWNHEAEKNVLQLWRSWFCSSLIWIGVNTMWLLLIFQYPVMNVICTLNLSFLIQILCLSGKIFGFFSFYFVHQIQHISISFEKSSQWGDYNTFNVFFVYMYMG